MRSYNAEQRQDRKDDQDLRGRKLPMVCQGIFLSGYDAKNTWGQYPALGEGIIFQELRLFFGTVLLAGAGA